MKQYKFEYIVSYVIINLNLRCPCSALNRLSRGILVLLRISILNGNAHSQKELSQFDRAFFVYIDIKTEIRQVPVNHIMSRYNSLLRIDILLN